MDFGMPVLIEINDLEETAALCRKLGLKFIELNMNLPQYQVEELEQISKFQKIQDKYGIYFTLHLDENINICDFNRTIANAYLDTVVRTIEVAKRLNIPVLNMHMHPSVYFSLPDKKVYLDEIYNDNYIEGIRRFRSACEAVLNDTDIKIAIENTEGYHWYEKEAIDYLLESNAFILTWDIGHSHVHKNKDEPFLLAYKRKLKHFHIHDAKDKNCHLALGEGEIDLRSRLLMAKQFGARCVLETKTVEALKASVLWINTNARNL